MARLVIPPNFIHRTELFKKVLAKDTLDGVNSIIRPFMTENDIVLADDDTDVDAAIVIHNEFDKFEKDAEKKTKERDNLFDPVWEDHVTMVQFLKKFYKKNISKLGDWDVEVNGNKIVYPVDFVNRRLTVLEFIAKHNSFAVGTSPLTSFLAEEENKVDIVQNKTDALATLAIHNEAKQFEQNAETKRQDRDLLMDPVTDHIEMIGNFLVGHYPKNPRKAGDWGYKVDTSRQKPKIQTTKLIIGETKTITNVAIGGTFTNLGEDILHVFKGNTTSGTPIIVNASGKLGMAQGFSTITVKNPSALLPGKFSVLRHK